MKSTQKQNKTALFFYLEEALFSAQRELADQVVEACFQGEELTPDLIAEKLPYIHFTDLNQGLSILAFDFLGFYRSDVTKFLIEMISRWLLPGRKLSLEAFSSTRFKFFEIEKQIYFAAKAVIFVESEEERSLIAYHIPNFLKEIRLGLDSFYHAKRILEVKGLSIDERTSFVQEKITSLIGRFPEQFDYDLFPLMQKFLLESSEEYKKGRSPDLLAQVIYTVYVFLRRLRERVEKVRYKRHLFLKMVRSKIQTLFGEKNVIGFFVGLNFLKENEIFDKRHLIKAVQKYFSEMCAIDASYFAQTDEEEGLLVFYIEMRKEALQDLTDEEIRFLKKELEKDLKGCIESLVRPVFMPRNEEEIMKYIVTLTNEIKFIRDLPQVVISFDEQTDRDLFFTVVLVRPLMPDTQALAEIFLPGKIDIQIEKVKEVGFVRKRFPKEAAVLKVRLSNIAFLRDDFAVDLYKARQKIVRYLHETLGEIRDYNGGMIAKQEEVLESFEKLLNVHGEHNHYLIESFFHSLYPIEMRTTLALEPFKTLFFLFRRLLTSEQTFIQKVEQEALYICVKVSDFKAKKNLLDAVQKLDIPNSELVKLLFSIQETGYIGFIYFTSSKIARSKLLKLVT